MEKKCRNGSKMSGERPSSRAPILRMEDVLELDAIVTPDTNEILQRTVREEEDEDEEKGEDGEGEESDTEGEDDPFRFETSSSSRAPKKHELTKKKKKRKRSPERKGPRLKGYDSFLSEEDVSETEAMGFDKSASLILSDKVEPDAVSELAGAADPFLLDSDPPDPRKRRQSSDVGPKQKCKKKECGFCSREQAGGKAKRPQLKRSNSQYKSCESDVSNNDSTHNKYYRSPSDPKTRHRKSVDRKLCNCYNRDYGLNKKHPKKYYSRQTSQDQSESLYSRLIFYGLSLSPFPFPLSIPFFK